MMHGLEVGLPRPGRRSGGTPKSEATRQAICTAARPAFIGRGYEGARIEDIAEAVKLTRRTIYNHFGDKQGLYEAVCSGLFRELRTRIDRRAVVNGGAAARLDAQITTVIAFLSDPAHDALARLIVQDGGTQPWLKLAYQRLLSDALWRGLCTAIAAWADEQGLLVNPDTIRDECRAVLEGSITFSRLIGRSPPLQSAPTTQTVLALLRRLVGDARRSAGKSTRVLNPATTRGITT